jgi:GATA zinc finger
LGEQNTRIRRERITGKPPPAEIPIPVSSDDEGSIVKQPRSNVVCASCKTRESEQWWKAPKGLSSHILCDECGITWRKYADFTKPPIREGSLPVAKGKGVEKREGTPLNGPNPKRAKVSIMPLFLLGLKKHFFDFEKTDADYPSSIVNLSTTASMFCLQPSWTCWESLEMSDVRISGTCRYTRFALLMQAMDSVSLPTGSCGVVLESKRPEAWVCDLCQNEETQDASIVRHL